VSTDAFGLVLNRPFNNAWNGDGRGIEHYATAVDSTSGLSLGCYANLWDVTTEQVLIANVEAGVETAVTVLSSEVTLTQDASAWVADIVADTPTAIVCTDDGKVYTGTQATFTASTTSGSAATIPSDQGIAISGYADETDQCTGEQDDQFVYAGILTEAQAREWCHYTLTQHGITPDWPKVAP
jgi:hypothetical protein